MTKVSKKNDDNPLISIIVPVYNVEKYLQKCIESIINQTYTNIEIILVDDGSNDKCPKICDEYLKKDNRISAFHKKNGGLSDARNYGIKEAKGEYISFVDSDDFVDNNYIEEMYKIIKEDDSDIAITSNRVIYSSKTIDKSNGERITLKPKDALKRMLLDDGIDVSANFKLYKKSLFDNVKFPLNRWYEDAATTYKILDKTEKISFYSVATYNYFMRDNSISRNKFSEKKLDLILSTNEMSDYISKKYPELTFACERRKIYAYMSVLSQLAVTDLKYPKIQKDLIKYVRKNGMKFLFSKSVALRDKIGIFCCYFGFEFYKMSWNLYLKLTGRK